MGKGDLTGTKTCHCIFQTIILYMFIVFVNHFRRERNWVLWQNRSRVCAQIYHFHWNNIQADPGLNSLSKNWGPFYWLNVRPQLKKSFVCRATYPPHLSPTQIIFKLLWRNKKIYSIFSQSIHIFVSFSQRIGEKILTYPPEIFWVGAQQTKIFLMMALF